VVPSSSPQHRRQWGRNIQAARLKHHETQAQLADSIHVLQQNVSRWERGVAIPRDDVKFRLAAHFNMAVGDLFPWDLPAADANGDEGQAA
jgi:transcriptional regulator with XRE-family HTH domain